MKISGNGTRLDYPHLSFVPPGTKLIRFAVSCKVQGISGPVEVRIFVTGYYGKKKSRVIPAILRMARRIAYHRRLLGRFGIWRMKDIKDIQMEVVDAQEAS